MTNRLDVNSGETYTIGSGETEEWFGADVDGTLEVNGTLKLIDNPDLPPHHEPDTQLVPDTSPIDLPFELDLPTGALNVRNMSTSTALYFVGFLTLVGGGAALLRNYAAGIFVAMAFVALILSGTMGLGLEVFYGLLIGAALLLAAGWGLRGATG